MGKSWKVDYRSCGGRLGSEDGRLEGQKPRETTFPKPRHLVSFLSPCNSPSFLLFLLYCSSLPFQYRIDLIEAVN